jgi:hypothetical protein
MNNNNDFWNRIRARVRATVRRNLGLADNRVFITDEDDVPTPQERETAQREVHFEQHIDLERLHNRPMTGILTMDYENSNVDRRRIRSNQLTTQIRGRDYNLSNDEIRRANIRANNRRVVYEGSEEQKETLHEDNDEKPQPPQFKKGGKVKGQKNKPVKAILHAGEVVIPNSLPKLQKEALKQINKKNSLKDKK